nr:transposase [Bradyrhizobium sp.]
MTPYKELPLIYTDGIDRQPRLVSTNSRYWWESVMDARHYHKRSNVESTFSMIKAKFRDHVRTKTDVAMKNEVLCKIICHNICCLIQEAHELGIDTSFWEKTSSAQQPVLN